MENLPAKNISSFTFFAFAITAPKPIPGKMKTLFACRQHRLFLSPWNRKYLQRAPAIGYKFSCIPAVMPINHIASSMHCWWLIFNTWSVRSADPPCQILELAVRTSEIYNTTYPTFGNDPILWKKLTRTYCTDLPKTTYLTKA